MRYAKTHKEGKSVWYGKKKKEKNAFKGIHVIIIVTELHRYIYVPLQLQRNTREFRKGEKNIGLSAGKLLCVQNEISFSDPFVSKLMNNTIFWA